MNSRFSTTDISAEVLRRLLDWIRSREIDVMQDIETFVSLETPSTDLGLLRTGLDWLLERSVQILGEPDRTHHFNGGSYGDISVLEYNGTEQGCLTFLCHYDTVWEEGTLSSWPYSVDNGRAVGPGIYDMKAGCIQALWVLAALSALGIARPTVRIMFTGDEEIGSEASRPVIESFAKDSLCVVLFEPSEDSCIKTARKGIGRFFLEVSGVPTHAGADYSKGTSAIAELAHIIVTLHALTRLDKGTTVNVGVVGGGTRSNVMAAHASADIDVRVTTTEEMERIDQAISVIGTRSPEARLQWSGGWNRPPMPRTDLTVLPYRVAAQVADSLDMELGEVSVGGGSDGNFAAALGVPVLDGMGAVGAHPHAPEEYIDISETIDRIAIAAGFVASLRAGSLFVPPNADSQELVHQS